MNKKTLVDFINKYHLGGLIEKSKLNSQDGKLSVKFISPTKELVGEISINTTPISDKEICIHNTSQLLRLLNIVGDEINMDLEGGKTPTRLNISDGGFHVSYKLADPSLIGTVPAINSPGFSYSFNLNEDVKTKIIKSNNALNDSVLVWIGTEDGIEKDQILLLFGENLNHSNKLSFNVEPISINDKSKLIPYDSTILKEILNANKGIDGICEVSKEGLMKLTFSNESGDSIYYLIRRSEER